jgi:hypothetical protein
MPFDPKIVDDLARAGVNIVVDAAIAGHEEIEAVVRLWEQGSGSLTIRNAGQIPSGFLLEVARKFNGRVTLEE